METFYIKELYSCYQRQQNVDKYREYFIRMGCKEEKEIDAGHIYIWTCAFRQDAKENSIKTVKELRKRYPNKKLTICGCMPAIDPEGTKRLAEEVGGAILPWKYENDFFDQGFLLQCDNVCGVGPIAKDIEKYKNENPDQPVSFADQFIKLCISEGCTCGCTYCSEKLAFPKYKSFAPEKIVEKCRELVDRTGNKKIILVADSPGEYGRDLGVDITDLMDALYMVDSGLSIALNNFFIQGFF